MRAGVSDIGKIKKFYQLVTTYSGNQNSLNTIKNTVQYLYVAYLIHKLSPSQNV